jgi:hypothetical protein
MQNFASSFCPGDQTKKEEFPSLNMYVYTTLLAKEKTQENKRQALDLLVHSRRRRRRRRRSSLALFVHKSERMLSSLSICDIMITTRDHSLTNLFLWWIFVEESPFRLW